MKKRLLIPIVLLVANYALGQNLPANPEPGKCYVKCITKDEFRTIEETVEVRPSYTNLEIVPATYKTISERVMVKEATKKMIYVPAVYETVEVAYNKREGRSDLEIVPASFGSDSRSFEVYPKTSGWEYKEVDGCSSENKEDCVIACFVEYPAQIENVSLTTLSKDATTSIIPINPQTATYRKKVIKTPARVDEVEVPAEYATITKLVIDTPATTRKVTVPAEYKTVTKTMITKKGGIMTWEEVDCGLLDFNILPILYEFNSPRLTVESKKIIDNTLLPLLNSKPVSIELSSHTDSRGNDDYNLALSQQRANAVVNYLVSKGITRNRLIAKGYGETRLLNNCHNNANCTEEQHHKNRRTEFRVIGN